MKNKTLRHFIPFVLISLLVPMLAYARKFPLTATPVVPGAKGYVDVGQDKNGNTEVDLKVEFLAKPSSLTPPAENYIVWFRHQGSEPESQGQLKVDDNLRGPSTDECREVRRELYHRLLAVVPLMASRQLRLHRRRDA